MTTINFEESIRHSVAAYWGIEKYRSIMETAEDIDISTDTKFQDAFTGYYGLRRDEKWRAKFYSIFEEAKNVWRERKKIDAYTRAEACADYRKLLERIHGERVEASFASKMLHTLDKNMPILDSRVCAALRIRIPSKWTIDRAAKVYGEIWDWYVSILSDGKEVIMQFDAMFPDAAGISDVKKIDFLLWGCGGENEKRMKR